MIIKGGKVFQEDGSFLEQALYINDHRLVDKAEYQDDEKVIDAEGLLWISTVTVQRGRIFPMEIRKDLRKSCSTKNVAELLPTARHR